MINSTVVRALQHSAGAKTRRSDGPAADCAPKSPPDALGNTFGFHLTGGQAQDLTGADHLLPDMEADTLIAGKAFDADDRYLGFRVSDAGSITVRVPLAIRRRPGRKTVVTPAGEAGDAPVRVRADPALVKALARAFRWPRMLDDGRYGSISEMARAEKIERGYLGKVLQLTLLAPDAVEAVLEGRRSQQLSLPLLLAGVPAFWSEQHR